MAEVWSEASWTGSWTYTRVKVTYSGTSATATMYFTRTNNWQGTTADYGKTFTFGGASVGFDVSSYGQITDQAVASVNFSISLDGGTYSGSSNGVYYGGSWSVSIPSQRTAPTGIWANNVVAGIDNFKANVYISGWGNYPADASSRYRELQCWTYNASSLVTPRRFKAVFGSSTSGNITVNNSSSGDLTIKGNTRYTLGVYASNGYMNTGSIRLGDYVTMPPAPTFSNNTIGTVDAKINYSTPADGGYHTKYLDYSLDNGSTWTQAVSLTGSAAKSGTFTITGLTPNTSYTVKTRTRTSVGSTAGTTLTFYTLDPVPSGYSLSIVNRSATTPVAQESQNVTWGVNTWGETATSGTVKLYRSTDQSNWTEVASSTATGTRTSASSNLAKNTTYYYKVSATNNLGKTTTSSIQSLVTKTNACGQGHQQSYKTYNTVNWYLNASYNAGGKVLSATIKYRLKYNNITTEWVTLASSVNPSSSTTYTSPVVVLPTATRYSCEVWVSTSAGDIIGTVDGQTLATHQGPTGVAYNILDGNTTLQNWLNTFDGYDGLIRINGKSQTGVRLTNGGTCSDGATLASGTARLNVDPVTISWTGNGAGTNRYFGNPTPAKFNNDLGFATETITVNVIDSLGANTTITKEYTAAVYEEPTIQGSAERLNVQGNLLVRIFGTYTRLWFGNLINHGEDCNHITFEYRVMNYDGSVKQDWTEITRFTTTVDPFKTYLMNYEGSVTLTDVDYLNSFSIEVRITDHFGSYTGDVEVDVWGADKVLYPTEYDVELWDWKTNSFVADISYLVIGDLNIDWTLNDVEQVSFEIDLEKFEEKCKDMNVDSVALLQPYAHDIRIRRNGQYIIGCQLVEANVQVNNDPPSKIQIKATGFLNLFKDQYIMNEAWGSYTYSEIAKRLIVEAQLPDCIVKNPTCDIDVGYWLANNGTVSYDTNAHAGDGCLVARTTGNAVAVGTEMSCKSGETLVLDVWVKGNQAQTVDIQERAYITQDTTSVLLGQYRLTGGWQHFLVPFTATYDDSYIVFRLECSDLALYIDECYVYSRDDSATFSNLGVVLGEDTATAVQSKTRQADLSLQNVKDAIMELTAMEEDNFDFDFSYDRKFNVYARKGQDRTNLEMSYPGNIHSMTVTRSAASLYNKITNIGSGVGDDRMQVVVENMDSQQKYGTRELVSTNSNVSLEETLLGQAVGALYDSKDPSDLPTITIKDGSINPSNIQVGDTVLPTVDSDEFLNTIEGIYRVAKLSLTVDEDDVETMKLTLEPEVERPQKKTIRYIRDCMAGNTVNTGNHWVQIEALVLIGNEYVNIAQGATVTTSGTSSTSAHQSPSLVTNGNLDSADYYSAGGNTQAVTVDLGDEYPVDFVKVWHYYADGRRYKENVCSVGNTLPSSATAPLETIVWKTTANTEGDTVKYPDSPRVETGSGRKSEWLQDGNIKGTVKNSKTIRYIKDTMTRPTYISASGGQITYGSTMWSLVQAFMRDVDGNWVDVAQGKTATIYQYNGNVQTSTRATQGKIDGYTYWSVTSGNYNSIVIDLGDEYPVEYIKIWHFAGYNSWLTASVVATNNTLSVGKTLVTGQDPLKSIVWENQNVAESAAGLCTPNLQGVLKSV